MNGFIQIIKTLTIIIDELEKDNCSLKNIKE